MAPSQASEKPANLIKNAHDEDGSKRAVLNRQTVGTTTPPLSFETTEEDAPGEEATFFNNQEFTPHTNALDVAKVVFGDALKLKSKNQTCLAKGPAVRALILRPKKDPTAMNLDRPSNVEAILCHVSGTKATEVCNYCFQGRGPFSDCVWVEGKMMGSCANCWFNASGARCSFQGNQHRSNGNPNLTREREEDPHAAPAPPGIPLRRSSTHISTACPSDAAVANSGTTTHSQVFTGSESPLFVSSSPERETSEPARHRRSSSRGHEQHSQGRVGAVTRSNQRRIRLRQSSIAMNQDEPPNVASLQAQQQQNQELYDQLHRFQLTRGQTASFQHAENPRDEDGQRPLEPREEWENLPSPERSISPSDSHSPTYHQGSNADGLRGVIDGAQILHLTPGSNAFLDAYHELTGRIRTLQEVDRYCLRLALAEVDFNNARALQQAASSAQGSLGMLPAPAGSGLVPE